ncbi:amidohydrolase [Microlunatus panaciterrae]|uniref:Amidohydrolase YtcJ n=1 Tax=Microlunatus panaciterrae TaxID=400768 RepID=A0ABS2RG64_9ACTN|nr:amidohydrolase [Microlunatus panaciterrae]MBM7797176.1 putative amidohydrolase YtcJ [Microlunatus panaciterrae]
MTACTVFTGGVIYRPGAEPCTAVVVQGGRIAYLGDDDGAQSWLGSPAEADPAQHVDLAGRLLTPAFVDAHLHTVQTGQKLAGLDLSAARRVEDVLDAVAGYAAANPDRRVIVGQGWDERSWPDPRPPLRSELDRAAGAVAVYLARVDVHSAVASSALLDRLPDVALAAGFTAEGWLTRDAHHLCRVTMDALFTDEERRTDARRALQWAAREGIASVHELGGPHLGPLQDLTRVSEVGAEVGIGVVTYWGELAGPESIERATSAGAAGLAGDLCVDGAIGSHTAALLEPYADADPELPGGGRGYRYLDVDQIADHVASCTRAGLQAGFHCIGDQAVAATVEGLRQAAVVVGAPALVGARHRLEHLEMIAEQDMATLAELGVVASMQPGFDAAWGGPGELYEQRLGPRYRQMNRLGTLHRRGVRLALGSDSPVTPIAGWATIRDATQHWQQDERLTVTEAFEAATIGGHRAAGDDVSGAMVVGAPAQLAVWDSPDGEPLSLDPSGLPELTDQHPLPRCVATLAAGRFIYSEDAQ